MANPILDEIQGLSPAAKGALGMAGHAVQNPAENPIPPNSSLVQQTASPEPAPITMPTQTPTLSMPSKPQLVTGPNLGHAMMSNSQEPTPMQQHQVERDRLISEGPGEDQIYSKITGSGFGQAHPFLGKLLGGITEGAAKLGDIGLSSVAPQLAVNLPGTAYHHQALLNHANQAVSQDEANSQTEAQTAAENAAAQKTAAETSEVAPLADAKINSENAPVDSARQKNAATLAKAGFKLDENGVIAPMAYEEMSPAQRSSYDLKTSQQQLADSTETLREAQAEVERAKGDPNSPVYQMAAQRLAVARQNAQAAAVRAQAYMGRYLQSAFNTDLNGNYLPGAPQIENEAGKVTTVGTGNASQARQAQASAAQFDDVHGALDSIEKTAKKLTDSGGKLNSPMVIAAMQAPHTTISQWIHSLSNYTLSPEERDYVMSNIALHENIQGLRKSAGGAATDSQVENLLKMAPGATTPDLDYLTRQTEQIRQTAERLGKGVVTARGGLNVRGQNANKPASTTKCQNRPRSVNE